MVNQMASVLTHRRDAPEVVRWRFEMLLDAGYDAATASALAKRVEIDLHLAVRLVETGCPQDTAVSILI